MGHFDPSAVLMLRNSALTHPFVLCYNSVLYTNIVLQLCTLLVDLKQTAYLTALLYQPILLQQEIGAEKKKQIYYSVCAVQLPYEKRRFVKYAFVSIES